MRSHRKRNMMTAFASIQLKIHNQFSVFFFVQILFSRRLEKNYAKARLSKGSYSQESGKRFALLESTMCWPRCGCHANETCIHEDLSSHRFLGILKAKHRNLIPNAFGTQLIFASLPEPSTPMRHCTHSSEKREDTTCSMGSGFFVRFLFDYPLMI